MRFLRILLIVLFCFNSASAQERKLVKEVNYLNGHNLAVIGLSDYPPFSYYNPKTKQFDGAFIKPLFDIARKHQFSMINNGIVNSEIIDNIKLALIAVKSGSYQLFVGAYSNTSIYKGLEIIYPAVVSNPLHIITLPDTQAKIHSTEDLKKLRGIVSKSEYFSDYALNKLKQFGVSYVDTSFEAYENLFTGKADYMIGSLYYNRIMASRYGVERYLSFSSKPLYKIPIFIAMSKVTPLMAEFLGIFKSEFSKPEFARAVKQEIVRIVFEEINKNDGIVPPSFAQNIHDEEQKFDYDKEDEEGEDDIDDKEEDYNLRSAHIVEKEEKTKEKNVDEVLEGI